MAAEGLDRQAFAYLADWIRQRSGLMLYELPADFSACRLQAVMRRFGFRSLAELVEELPHDSAALSIAVTGAMTVGDTVFFRDANVFVALRDVVLPALIARRAAEKKLNIWCAACAGGQEVYSLAILLADFGLTAAGWTISLSGTDLRADAIEAARVGLYRDEELASGVSVRHRNSYFIRKGDGWQVCELLRNACVFNVCNLLQPFDAHAAACDLIMCRNVLMYFDSPSRSSVVRRLTKCLHSGGVLVLGAGEMLPAGEFLHSLPLSAPGFYAAGPLR